MTEQIGTTTTQEAAPVETPDVGFDVNALLASGDDAPAETVKEEAKEPVKDAAPVEKKEEAPIESKPVEAKPVEEVKPLPEATKPEAPEPEKIDLAALRKSTLEQLEKAAEITDTDMIELLRTEPEKALPRLVAKAKLETYEAVTSAIIQQLPGFISAFNARMAASDSVQERFLSRWPQLKDPKFESDIVNAAKLHTQLNPTASLEQRIEDIGAMLVVRHKLFAPVEEPKAPLAAAPSATTKPVAPTRPGAVLSDTRAPASPFAELLALED